jgi:hypothetical protein
MHFPMNTEYKHKILLQYYHFLLETSEMNQMLRPFFKELILPSIEEEIHFFALAETLSQRSFKDNKLGLEVWRKMLGSSNLNCKSLAIDIYFVGYCCSKIIYPKSPYFDALISSTVALAALDEKNHLAVLLEEIVQLNTKNPKQFNIRPLCKFLISLPNFNPDLVMSLIEPFPEPELWVEVILTVAK